MTTAVLSKLFYAAITLAISAGVAGSPCNVTDYGARGDGKTLNTRALQAAIDACHAGGGGRVVFPSGRFLTGTLQLKSNLELYFAPGTLLLGSTNLDDYRAPRAGDSSDNYQPLLVGKNVENLTITGAGIIDGQGESFWDKDFYSLDIPRPTLPRPKAWFLLDACRNVTIRDITLQHSPIYSLTLQNCDNVVIDGISVLNDFRSPNTDGIQIKDSADIRISNCTIATGDDAIVLKSRRRAVENILVDNCHIQSDDGAIKFGTGSAHGVKNSKFSNLLITRTHYGIALFMKDGGIHENNTFHNITIHTGSRHKTDYPIYIDIDRRNDESPLGSIRNLVFSEIDIVTRDNILIAGHGRSPIEQLTLNNVRMQVTDAANLRRIKKKPSGNVTLKRARDSEDYASINSHITLANINQLNIRQLTIDHTDKASGRARGFIHLENLHNTHITGFSARQALRSNTAVIQVNRSRDLYIAHSRAPLGSSRFLALDNHSREPVTLLGNDLRSINIPWELPDSFPKHSFTTEFNLLKRP